MTDAHTLIEDTLEKMITHQKAKVLTLAREIHPGTTPEDIRNPQDLPALYNDPSFNYEDGILAGYLSAQVALRAKLRGDE